MGTQWRPSGLSVVHFLEHPAHRNRGQAALGHEAATHRISLSFVVVCMVVRLTIERGHRTDMAITDQVPHLVGHGRREFFIRERCDEAARNIDLPSGPGIGRERFTGEDMEANFSAGWWHRLEQRQADTFDPRQRTIDNEPTPLLSPGLRG